MEEKSKKLQIPFRLDLEKDECIYDMIYFSDDRTNLIKNALFYYLHDIESGKVIDRHFPYSKLNLEPTINKTRNESSNIEITNTHAETQYEEDEIDEDIEYEEYYDEDDNMDSMDI